MKHLNRISALFAGCLLLCSTSAFAWGVDPVRAALIDQYSKQAKKTLEAQNRAQALMTTGHLWMQTAISCRSCPFL